MALHRPWPVTALGVALALNFCFTLYVAINAMLPVESGFEEGRAVGMGVGTVVIGGLLVGSVLSMSRWPYVLFGFGALSFVWRVFGGGIPFSRDWMAWYSGVFFVVIFVVAALHWNQMSWAFIRFRSTQASP